MEWTQSLQVLPGSGERHMVTDDIRDIDPVTNLIDDVVRNQASAHESTGFFVPVMVDRRASL